MDSNTTNTCYQENSLKGSVATSATAEDFSVHLFKESIDIYKRLMDSKIKPEDVHDNDVIVCIARSLDDILKIHESLANFNTLVALYEDTRHSLAIY